MDSRSLIRRELLRLAGERGPEKSFCPSEIARRVLPHAWRSLMPLVRQVAGQLVDEGRLTATQRGRTVHPENARGPIRLRVEDSADNGHVSGML